MNSIKKLKETKFLSLDETYQLVSDIIDEDSIGVSQVSKNRNVIAWYLRYRHYLPFKLITDLLDYKGSSSAAEAVFSLEESSDNIPVSFSPRYSDLLGQYAHVANYYYGCSKNIYMDRGVDEGLEDALLFGSSKACSVIDKHNKVSWYKSTPKNSNVYNLMTIMDIAGVQEISEDQIESIISNYEIRFWYA